MTNKSPNLFEFATSELSQDAFLCYLLSFSKVEYKETYPLEYKFSRKFIGFILEKVELDIEVTSVEVERQYKNIDVLLILNGDNYIVIEDKTNTNEGFEQIKSYVTKIKEETSKDSVRGIYFKTGDESLENLKNKEFSNIKREEVIEVFKNYDGDNLIFNEFNEHLKDMQNKRDAYKVIPPQDYRWHEIIGFYKSLDTELNKLQNLNRLPKDIKFNWGYTPNQNGGFMCYYFQNVLDLDGERFYLQIEKIKVKNSEVKQKRNTCWTEIEVPYPDTTLVVKRESDNKNIDISYKVLELFKDKFQEKFEEKILLKPNRFSKGSWMTQILINDYIALGDKNTIDVEGTAVNISKYLELIRELAPDLKKICETI